MRGWLRAGIAATVIALAGTAPRTFVPGSAGSAPPVVAVHANTLGGKYVFVSRRWDLARIREAFNTVIVASVPDGGDLQLVRDAAAAGLRVYVEFDKKREYAEGRDISPTVAAVVDEARAVPGLISGIRVADRLNEFLDPDTSLGYLRATGGVFHREIPGIPVLVDANDWELTCGYSGQSSCTDHLQDRFRFERNDVLELLYRSGYVDGFLLSDNIKNFDVDVQAAAWRRARAMYPRPFLLFSASPELSFPDPAYPSDPATARREVDAIVRTPLALGADGVDIWAWHRPWDHTLRTILNKDGAPNALWTSLVEIASPLLHLAPAPTR